MHVAAYLHMQTQQAYAHTYHQKHEAAAVTTLTLILPHLNPTLNANPNLYLTPTLPEEELDLKRTIVDKMKERVAPPVPSLFAFDIRGDSCINPDLAGVAVPRVRIEALGHSSEGPLLITHRGM